MKQKLIFALCIVLLLGSLVGCAGDGAATPTDLPVINSTVNETLAEDKIEVESMVDQLEEPEQEQEEIAQKAQSTIQPNQTEAEEKQTSQVAKTDKTKVPSQNTVANQSQQEELTAVAPGNEDSNCVIPDYPTFTSQEDLKAWFQSGTQWSEDRADIMSQYTTNATTTYYRPSIPENHSLFALDYVEIHTPTGGIGYYYEFVGESTDISPLDLGLVIGVYPPTYDYYTKAYKERLRYANNNEFNCTKTEVDGITFVCRYTEDSNMTSVCWMQNGVGHNAFFHGYRDKLDQILPLLKLQQVTINPDHVTE